MRNIFVFLFCLIVISYNHSWGVTGIDAKWEKVRGGKGVVVFAADVPGKDVVAFRGETTINAPIKKLVAALYDIKRKPEWMHELQKVRVIRNSGQKERIEHYHSKTPWPLDDRDFVYKVRFNLSEDKKKFVLYLKNYIDTSVPSIDGVVRGRLYESYYVLNSIKNGLSTKVTLEVLADPMGLVPKWLVNLFQRMWPINTLDGLRTLMEDADFQVDPFVENIFNN